MRDLNNTYREGEEGAVCVLCSYLWEGKRRTEKRAKGEMEKVFGVCVCASTNQDEVKASRTDPKERRGGQAGDGGRETRRGGRRVGAFPSLGRIVDEVFYTGIMCVRANQTPRLTMKQFLKIGASGG
mmetsp:Transcript_17843/g.33180  ORF Transcript_17843/g.33180 Transcript_17843/m.33180 type:complete len:127 (-) Transcript_17843:194-574(-)